MSELRTLKPGRGRPRVPCVQGRLSMLYDSADETGHVQVKSSPAPKTEAPVELGPPSVKNSAPSVVFHPLAYRGVVADWPVELRERWGQRANALEESGLSWRDAEAQAFVEVWNFARGHQTPQSAEATPVS